MHAEALAVMVALTADFVFNRWDLETLPYYRIRHISCCVRYHAQSLRLEAFKYFYAGRGCGSPELSNRNEYQDGQSVRLTTSTSSFIACDLENAFNTIYNEKCGSIQTIGHLYNMFGDYGWLFPKRRDQSYHHLCIVRTGIAQATWGL
jgi:hypothetical protein